MATSIVNLLPFVEFKLCQSYSVVGTHKYRIYSRIINEKTNNYGRFEKGGKGKVFYGRKPASRESTTTECGDNYQLLSVIYWSSPMGTPSSSRPQQATDNGVKDGRSNWLVVPSALHRAVPPELHVLHGAMRATNHKTCCNEWGSNARHRNASLSGSLCGHSGYNSISISNYGAK